MIAHDGSLYRCWHDLSDPNMSVGNIKDLTDINAQKHHDSSEIHVV